MLQRIAERGGVDTMPLRALSVLLFLGGILYALLSGNWGIGAIAFGLGAVVLGLDRLRVARGRPERAIGVWKMCSRKSTPFIAPVL